MRTLYPNVLSLLLFLSGVPLFAQPAADWRWQNPLPTGNSLLDVQFLNAQTGYACGRGGTILKSGNGGQDWRVLRIRDNKTFYGLHFVDPQLGWLVGDSGTILRTINGGRTWVGQGSGSLRHLKAIHFRNGQLGWAAGNLGTILKTTNGGQNWVSQTSGTNSSLTALHFVSEQRGWAVGESGVIRATSNGGQSWQVQNAGTSQALNSVFFLDELRGWAVGESGILVQTTDGGLSWNTQSSGTSSGLKSIHFSGQTTGWVSGTNGFLVKTTDGGQSWTSQQSGFQVTINCVFAHNDQSAWLVGDNGQILATQNGGGEWQRQGSGMTIGLTAVSFPNNQTGWAVGNFGKIFRTNDGGQSWQAQSNPNPNFLFGVHFINPDQGWAVGWDGTIVRTQNGGQTWTSQTSGTSYILKSVYFINHQTGWAVGNLGTILKTTDGGQFWQAQFPGGTADFASVFFTDSQRGWVAGNVILRTTDGGNTWLSTQGSSSIYGHSSIHFPNPQRGWAVGPYGEILHSSDGGQTWVNQNSGTQKFLHSVHFVNSLLGWVVGEGGIILKTTNGGLTWQTQFGNAANRLLGVDGTDEFHVWAVGDGGSILRLHPFDVVDPQTPSVLFSGLLFKKNDADCVPTNQPVSPQLVKVNPGPYYGVSNPNGQFEVRVPVPTSGMMHAVEPVVTPAVSHWMNPVCPQSGSFSVPVGPQPDTLFGYNFGFEVSPCHHMTVQLSSNRRRRCFRNTTSVWYKNQGASPAPNAHVLVTFPHWVYPISASRPHTAVNDSVWRFDLGTVAPGASGSIVIQDSVRCGVVEILGMSQCTRATVFPAPDCPPPGNWSGAAVSVSGLCDNGLVKLGIYNRTNVDMPDSVDYWVYLDSIQVRVGKVKLAAGDSLLLQVMPAGMGVYLSVDQVAHHPTQVFVSTAVEGCQTNPIPLSMASVSTHLPISQQPNSKTQCLPIIGAYDPNDKQGFPIGFTDQNVIAPDTRLEYLIRFQNTGNDTAFTVYVIDTLDENLNVESVEMGAASHPYQLRMQTTRSGKTYLRWQFNNILLPDSNTNEPASNGFIQFRISPKADLSLGTRVRNQAEIYFDFNPPIITNRTLTTYDVLVFENPNLSGNVQVVTSAAAQLAQLGVKLYPNPVKGSQVTASFSEPGSLTMFDARGVAVYTKDHMQGTEVLPVHLKPGLYVARIHTQKGQQGVKLVVE